MVECLNACGFNMLDGSSDPYCLNKMKRGDFSSGMSLGNKYGWSMVRNTSQPGSPRWEKKFMINGSQGQYGIEGLGTEVQCYFVDKNFKRTGSKFCSRLVSKMLFDEMEVLGQEADLLFHETSSIIEFMNDSGEVTMIGCFEGFDEKRRIRAFIDHFHFQDAMEVEGNEDTLHHFVTLDDAGVMGSQQIELLLPSSSQSSRLVKMYMGELWKSCVYQRMPDNGSGAQYSNEHCTSDADAVMCAVKWVRNSRLPAASSSASASASTSMNSPGAEPLNEIKVMKYLSTAIPHTSNSNNNNNNESNNNNTGVIPLVDVVETPMLTGIVMPFYKDGDLFDYICSHNTAPYTEAQAVAIFYKVCYGLRTLHRAGVCHRDLSAENVLITLGNNTVMDCVLTDFGQSLILEGNGNTQNERTYKKLYRPPELADEQLVASHPLVDYKKADLWALGVIFYLLLTRSMPFDETSYAGQRNWFKVASARSLGEQLLHNNNKGCCVKDAVSAEALELLTKLLAYDPRDRVGSVDDVLSCSLFIKKQ